MIPIHHWPNHEIALITKFFEYSHARLPLVVSDVRTMAATVRSTGQGEVFRAEDVDDFVRALSAVLADPEQLPGRVRQAWSAAGLDLGGAGRGAHGRLPQPAHPDLEGAHRWLTPTPARPAAGSSCWWTTASSVTPACRRPPARRPRPAGTSRCWAAPRTASPQTWQLGDAEVRLLPGATPCWAGARTSSAGPAARPLAYPPNGIGPLPGPAGPGLEGRHRVPAGAAAGRRRARRCGPAVPCCTVQWFAARLYGRWVGLRRSGADPCPAGPAAPWTRRPTGSYTWFWQRVKGDRRVAAARARSCGTTSSPTARSSTSLQPDLIHAHDFRMLGVGARAEVRARGRGPHRQAGLGRARVPARHQAVARQCALAARRTCAHEREYAPLRRRGHHRLG